MTDHELVDAFEAERLAPEELRHREHLRLAWLYLARFGRDEAERRMLDGLRRFAARAGKPEKFDRALTAAWIGALADAARTLGAAAPFDALVTARPELLDPASVRRQR